MQPNHFKLSAAFFVCSLGLSLGLFSSAGFAQTVPGNTALTGKSCILAGRLNTDQRWAPLANGVTLLNAQGKPVAGASQQALASVVAVKLDAPMLLSQCNGNQALPSPGADTGSKAPVPTINAGLAALKVEAMYYPPGRSGGQWVELQLDVPAERVVVSAR